MSAASTARVSKHDSGLPALRPAEDADLDALTRLEAACFETDRISRRSFRRFLGRHTAELTVAEDDSGIVGYVLTLFRSGTALGRLYSLAVTPEARGRGLGRLLTGVAEDAALQRDCILLRLEVRPDNDSAIALYKALGYRVFDRIRDYYEDHADALRFQKLLRAAVPEHPVPLYYAQTTDFTCGPAAMLMAMNALDPTLVPTRQLELRLWREATTIYMAAGHGGCEPVGLALTAARRGIAASVHVNQAPPFFIDSVRNEDKREVMTMIQEEFVQQATTLGIPIKQTPLGMDELRVALDRGQIALVLVSHYRMTGDRTPHWIVVYGHDGRRAFAHDPWIEPDELETPLAVADLPIPWMELGRMARYGRSRLQATVLLGPISQS